MSDASSNVSFGIGTPRALLTLPTDKRRELLGAVVDAGIDHIFIADHVSFRGGSGIDGLIHLTAVGALEPRLGVFTGIYLLPLRHPVIVARQLATMAEVVEGPITFGIGVGGEDRHEFDVCDVDPATRGRRTNAMMPIVRRLLAGETVTHHDEFFAFDEASIVPTPQRYIPMVVGGRSDAAIKRAADHGDGWLATWVSAKRMAAGMQEVEERGADRGITWQHGIQMWAGVGADVESGTKNAAYGMQQFYQMPFEPFAKYTPCGTGADLAEFIAPYIEAGVTTVNVNMVGPDPYTEIEAIADAVRLLRS